MGYVIASRKSDLARIQALHVGAVFKKKFPEIPIEHFFRPSLGDLNQADPLWKMPEKGVFTEDFRRGLIDGSFDMVVHSWKDLPVDCEPGTQVVATLPRADMRDLFLCKKSHWPQVQSEKALRVLTSSPRRMHNLTPFFKSYLPAAIEKVHYADIRGNVPTRLEKLLGDKDADAMILAKAAWDRLMTAPEAEFAELQKKMKRWLKDFYWMVLPLRSNPCAAAQGALAVEIAQGRDDLKTQLLQIHCQATWEAVHQERALLKSHGGGCHQKIGVSVLNRDYGTMTFAKGENEEGIDIGKEVLTVSSRETRFSIAESFPTAIENSRRWFDRETLEIQAPPSGHHFVARANSLPESHGLTFEDCVWTSGLKTWLALAERGVWVSGSVESLGEKEDFRLGALVEEKPWFKWTHQQGSVSKKFKNLASYRLVPKTETPDLHGKSNFFWMSGSSFRFAAKKFPEILAANHYCGPGQTFSTIVQTLSEADASGTVEMVLGYQDWAQKTWKGK